MLYEKNNSKFKGHPKILNCLENETGEIIMDKETIEKARISVERMAAIGR